MIKAFRYGGGVGASVIHPVVLAAVLLAILLIFVIPRKQLVVPVMLVAFFAPFGQQLYVAGQHLPALRIVTAAGLLRLAIRPRKDALLIGGFNSIDQIFCLWAALRVVTFILLYKDWGAVTNQAAFLLDYLVGYFFLRYAIQDEEDIARTAKILAVTTAVMGACMLNEKFRGLNIFGYLGSVPIQPAVRDGSIRAQGAFGHPVLAGVFGATLVPLFFWLWKSGRGKVAAVTGFAGSTMMVLGCASSTPVMAYVAGILSLSLWPIRDYMRWLRWGIVLTLLSLALVMKAPVWFIIAHADVVSKSSGWHRAELVDTFVRHFGDWWVLGSKDNDTWGYEMVDTSNQFINEGVTGGLCSFICFIMIVKRCFSRLEKERRLIRGDRNKQWFLWSLCAVMISHITAFWGTAYWDQTRFWWLACLVSISAVTVTLGSASVETERASKSEPSAEPWQWHSALLHHTSPGEEPTTPAFSPSATFHRGAATL